MRLQWIQDLPRSWQDHGQDRRKGGHRSNIIRLHFVFVTNPEPTTTIIPPQTFTFLDKKCERSFLMKRNPRKVTWTVLYRRKHKKGIEEEQVKKRSRRTQKFQRAIVGASLTEIMAKRNMKPEVRKAQREQAIK